MTMTAEQIEQELGIELFNQRVEEFYKLALIDQTGKCFRRDEIARAIVSRWNLQLDPASAKDCTTLFLTLKLQRRKDLLSINNFRNKYRQ